MARLQFPSPWVHAAGVLGNSGQPEVLFSSCAQLLRPQFLSLPAVNGFRYFNLLVEKFHYDYSNMIPLKDTIKSKYSASIPRETAQYSLQVAVYKVNCFEYLSFRHRKFRRLVKFKLCLFRKHLLWIPPLSLFTGFRAIFQCITDWNGNFIEIL